MAQSRSIPRAEWPAFFHRIADATVGKQVEVEAASLELGDQIIAEWLPLLGLTYDSHDDLLDVALHGLTHLIRSPREIVAQEGPRGLELIAVLAADEVKHILRLKDPLRLPAPEQSHH